jgi:transcription elongation factor Elf1
VPEIILKEKYSFKCPLCAFEMEGPPSSPMHAGVNRGIARCNSCGTALHVEIVPDLTGDQMRAEVIRDYLRRIQREALDGRS